MNSSTITFDTLEYMDELKRSGMKAEEAEAITKATQKAFSQMLVTKEVATKSDVKAAELHIRKEINESMWKTIGMLATLQTVILSIFGFVQYFTR